ncbi:predicted protein [Nematostella vectensis]|uniref:Uncharacterized protein n=1 Tax=Nematostella vectensis TaxID=45351 RepID=A7RJ11_NEMVE|nr:uncharacterized protein LOC5520847 [Nematostella vectensis]EDO48601.1 predicted protein [Nematostella vectensis]|eukprot:XP_001640664.1 predicted protein [Nematostella vectensis]
MESELVARKGGIKCPEFYYEWEETAMGTSDTTGDSRLHPSASSGTPGGNGTERRNIGTSGEETTRQRSPRKEEEKYSPKKLATEDSKNKGTSQGTQHEDEDEGTYEELICLVRQFYVERPLNPAALAHQNIETC